MGATPTLTIGPNGTTVTPAGSPSPTPPADTQVVNASAGNTPSGGK